MDQGIALFGAAENWSSNMLENSALLERVCCFLLAALASDSASMSSAFRRPRFGLHSGSSARIARSSSAGIVSRTVVAKDSSDVGLSVMYSLVLPCKYLKKAST